MQYTTLGNTGLVVSRFAFGAMTFGEGEMVAGVQNTIDLDQATEMVALALDAGINLFDTADAYRQGESEVMLGKALGARRHEVIIATKVGFRTSETLTDTGLSYQHIMASAEASLRRLGRDYIDLYLLHKPDPLTPVEETLRALDDLTRRGMVRYVGYSNFPAWLAARMMGMQQARNQAPFVCAQMYYSLLGRDLEHEVVPFARNAGLGIMAWSPLASGFLSGKYTRDTPVPEGARREKFAFPPVDVEKGYEVVEALQTICARHHSTPAQTALAWLLTQPFISSIIIGASKMSQLEDNLQAAHLTLSEDEINQLDMLTAPDPIYPNYMIQAMAWDPKVQEAINR